MKNRQAAKPVTDGQLRIIGGKWRGRKLSFPTPDGLRPTGDRIRETLFNWLQSDIADAQCLDLFAGSGALGLEALSRGAASCALLELDKQAAQRLTQNCALLKAETAKVHHVDSLFWLEHQCAQSFNLVFIDPPFSKDLWHAAFAALNQPGRLMADALIYIECPKEKVLDIPSNWALLKEKAAGNLCYRLYRLL